MSFCKRIMVKTRKIKIGDFVIYCNKEYVVTKKNKKQFTIVRRMVRSGAAAVVPKERVKLADQAWRGELQRGDPIQFFIGGQWINASVYEREGKDLFVQPSLSNYTKKVSQDSGLIAKGSHSYPLWVKDDITPVVVDGECQIERGNGLIFPWTYLSESSSRIVVSGPLQTYLTTLTFPVYETRGLPLSMYNTLSKDEIFYSICTNQKEHPEVLADLAIEWCYGRLPIYPYLQNVYGLRHYISQALAHDDQRRVQELLSVGDGAAVFHKSEWLIREDLGHPYIDAEFSYSKKTLSVKLFYSGIKVDKTRERTRKILKHISVPMVYAPKVISVDSTPELQYILSRMLGKEQEPVELLSTRKINTSKILINLEHGFCSPELRTCGGQLNFRHVSYPILVKELMKRSPMRTLVVVETNALPIWKEFNHYYGRNRSFEPITVTTKAMFLKISRSESFFDRTQRLIVIVDTRRHTTFATAVRNFRCKIKWVTTAPIWSPDNSSVFPSQHLNELLTIRLSKPKMLSMGVEFPLVTHQPVVFDVDLESCRDFIARLRAKHPTLVGWRKDFCVEQLALFLHHPELVPVQFRGDRLAAVEATLKNISAKFGVSEELLESRAEEICSVCLEKITDASVTPCGHIFCTECMQELHNRQINCPMCRAKIPKFLKLSDKDTVGRIEVSDGVPYRLPEHEEWGKKMQFLKKYEDATIITGSEGWSAGGLKDTAKILKRKLKKIFRKRQILTFEEMLYHQPPVSPQIINMTPNVAIQQCVGLAWGKDIEVLELRYRVRDSPFGVQFY